MDKISTNTLVDAYKTLVDDYCRPYTMYVVLADILDGLNSKIGNIGVVRTRDEYVDNLTDSERDRLYHNFMYKADFYCRRLQQYLLNCRNDFPELDDCACENIKTHLNSAASTDIFLGGAGAAVYEGEIAFTHTGSRDFEELLGRIGNVVG